MPRCSDEFTAMDDKVAVLDAPRAYGNCAARLERATLAVLLQQHALPEQRWTMSYDQVLAASRPLIAGVIRQDYQKLAGAVA